MKAVKGTVSCRSKCSEGCSCGACCYAHSLDCFRGCSVPVGADSPLCRGLVRHSPKSYKHTALWYRLGEYKLIFLASFAVISPVSSNRDVVGSCREFCFTRCIECLVVVKLYTERSRIMPLDKHTRHLFAILQSYISEVDDISHCFIFLSGSHICPRHHDLITDVVHFRCFACLHDLPDLSHARCTFHCCSCHKVQKHILCVEFLHDFLAC